jgi:hypothetical protein
MALLINNKLVYIHTPKTGGTWIRRLVDRLRLPAVEIGHTHAHFPELLQYHPLEFYTERLMLTTVRHPLTWYQSRWTHRMQNGWHPTHPLDFNCASNDFKTFVNNVLHYCPTGWVSREYDNHIDSIPAGFAMVARMEDLLADITQAFMIATDGAFDVSVAERMPLINASSLEQLPSSHWARYDRELLGRTMAAERMAINRYYARYKLDQSALLDG